MLGARTITTSYVFTVLSSCAVTVKDTVVLPPYTRLMEGVATPDFKETGAQTLVDSHVPAIRELEVVPVNLMAPMAPVSVS